MCGCVAAMGNRLRVTTTKPTKIWRGAGEHRHPISAATHTDHGRPATAASSAPPTPRLLNAEHLASTRTHHLLRAITRRLRHSMLATARMDRTPDMRLISTSNPWPSHLPSLPPRHIRLALTPRILVDLLLHLPQATTTKADRHLSNTPQALLRRPRTTRIPVGHPTYRCPRRRRPMVQERWTTGGRATSPGSRNTSPIRIIQEARKSRAGLQPTPWHRSKPSHLPPVLSSCLPLRMYPRQEATHYPVRQVSPLIATTTSSRLHLLA